MTDKKTPERRGPASPGSPDDMKGVEKKQTNPHGPTPEQPTVTPRVPTNGQDDGQKED